MPRQYLVGTSEQKNRQIEDSPRQYRAEKAGRKRDKRYLVGMCGEGRRPEDGDRLAERRGIDFIVVEGEEDATAAPDQHAQPRVSTSDAPTRASVPARL
eukprot:3700150-Rhodomonas_salina.1